MLRPPGSWSYPVELEDGNRREMETIDQHFMRVLRDRSAKEMAAAGVGDLDVEPASQMRSLFDAQLESRHLDFAARWLQSQDKGYYTIASAGHESNAALGLLSRRTDRAPLLHYRSGGFDAARAALGGQANPARDILLSLTSAQADPMSGGRHKVYGHPGLSDHSANLDHRIAPAQSSRLGLTALDLSRRVDHHSSFPYGAVVICSFGDASVNHSTVAGALNAAAYLVHRNIGCPLLFVCEDNGIGISTPTPDGWSAAALQSVPGLRYRYVDGADPVSLLAVVTESLADVRESRAAGILHLRTVRFMEHAGSDAEIAYRSQTEILADYTKDPLAASANALVDAGILSPSEVLHEYDQVRQRVMDEAHECPCPGATGQQRKRHGASCPARGPSCDRADARTRCTTPGLGGRLPEDGPPLTLAQTINATLTDLMVDHPNALVFGEDVAVRAASSASAVGCESASAASECSTPCWTNRRFWVLRSALLWLVSCRYPKSSIWQHLYNAEDQLRGEAATLGFFSNGQYRNGPRRRGSQDWPTSADSADTFTTTTRWRFSATYPASFRRYPVTPARCPASSAPAFPWRNRTGASACFSSPSPGITRGI